MNVILLKHWGLYQRTTPFHGLKNSEDPAVIIDGKKKKEKRIKRQLCSSFQMNPRDKNQATPECYMMSEQQLCSCASCKGENACIMKK